MFHQSRSTILLAPRACPEFFTGARPKAESGGGVLGKGQQPPPHQLGERCELSSGVRGGVTIARRFSTILRTQDGLFWHYIVLLIVDYHAAVGVRPVPPPLPCVRPCLAHTTRSVGKNVGIVSTFFGIEIGDIFRK